MRLPKPLQNLTDAFEQLPGIGPKTAERLTFYLLRVPQEDLDKFSSAVSNLKKTTICKICKNVGEEELCEVCSDPKRDTTKICVVESPLDVLALEKSGYNGLYHVLHGAINPIAGIGPEELFIEDLLERISRHSGKPEGRIQNLHNTDSGLRQNDEEFGQARMTLEIILATNPDLEGEATAMYIRNKIMGSPSSTPFPKITRIGRGLPTGGDLEYADETTLKRAMEGRTAA